MPDKPVEVKAGSAPSVKEIKVKVKVKMDREKKRNPARKSSRR